MARQGCPIDPTEQAVVDFIHVFGKRRWEKHGPLAVHRTGREHTFKGCKAWQLGGLRFMPDLLVSESGRSWSLFLECKNSSSDAGLCVKVEALETYRQIQTLSGKRIYVVTTTEGWVGLKDSGAAVQTRTFDNRQAEEFKLRGGLVVAQVNRILEAGYPVKDSVGNRDWPYIGEASRQVDPYMVIPRSAFTWPLRDLLQQMRDGKKRPRPPSMERDAA